jgi:hypothetical protein
VRAFVSGMKSQTRTVPITFQPASAVAKQLESAVVLRIDGPMEKRRHTPGEGTLRAECSEETRESECENEVTVGATKRWLAQLCSADDGEGTAHKVQVVAVAKDIPTSRT